MYLLLKTWFNKGLIHRQQLELVSKYHLYTRTMPKHMIKVAHIIQHDINRVGILPLPFTKKKMLSTGHVKCITMSLIS